MSQRIIEPLSRQFGFFYESQEQLHYEQTPYQKLEIVRTEEFGRVMLLDGCTQVGEKKHFQYHELIGDASMLSHPLPQKILIIGGGDGGVASHVSNHPSVAEIFQVELDEAVPRCAQKFMPSVGGGVFSDPRFHLEIANGKTFLEQSNDTWDVIIMDLTDPVGPVLDLYQEEFFQRVRTALADELSVFSLHTSSPIIDEKLFGRIQKNLHAVFSEVMTFYSYIQMYGTLWTVSVVGRGNYFSALTPGIIRERIENRKLYTQLELITGKTYFSLQQAPPYIAKLL